MSNQSFGEELSEADLARIEALVAAATVGPWFSYVAGRDADARSTCIELGACNELGSFKAMELIGATVADQDFIASARQDLPRLLSEVRRLRARLSVMSQSAALQGALVSRGIAEGATGLQSSSM